MSGEWMKDFRRTASEKIRTTPAAGITSATESLSRSIKESFRAGFLSRSFQQESPSDEPCGDQVLNNTLSNTSSPSVLPDKQKPVTPIVFRRMPVTPKRLLIDPRTDQCISNPLPDSTATPFPFTPACSSQSSRTSSVAHGKSFGSSDSKDESPKLPPSPVLRTLRAERPSPIDISRKNNGRVAGRKISGLLASSSSDEEEEEDDRANRILSRKKSSSTDESTPSPRTPNSCKILSGIEKNQATAFYFPPSPFRSRPSSLEKENRQMSERQSSDDTHTSISSIRSRSTSSEVFDEPVLAAPLTGRSHRINPLRKQLAIAEEAGNEQQPLSSTADSGLSDCPPATPPNSRNRSRISNISASSQSDSRECLETALSFSENEETYTSTIFRKVTIKKRVAPIPGRASPCPVEADPPRPASEPLSSSSCRSSWRSGDSGVSCPEQRAAATFQVRARYPPSSSPPCPPSNYASGGYIIIIRKQQANNGNTNQIMERRLIRRKMCKEVPRMTQYKSGSRAEVCESAVTTAANVKINRFPGGNHPKDRNHTATATTVPNGKKQQGSILAPDFRCKGYDAECPRETNQNNILRVFRGSQTKSCNLSAADERQSLRNNSRAGRSLTQIRLSDPRSESSHAITPHGAQRSRDFFGAHLPHETVTRCNDEQRLQSQARRRLRVTSYLRMSGGVAYIEDSDWEICSAASSSGFKFNDSSSESVSESLIPSPSDPLKQSAVADDCFGSRSLWAQFPKGNLALVHHDNEMEGAAQNEEQQMNLLRQDLQENYGQTKEVSVEMVSFAREVAKETIRQQNESWCQSHRQRRSDVSDSGMNGRMRGIRNWELFGESDHVKLLDLDDEKVRSDGLRQLFGRDTSDSPAKLILTPTEQQEHHQQQQQNQQKQKQDRQRMPPNTAFAGHKRAECKGNVNNNSSTCSTIRNSVTMRDRSSVGGGRRMGRNERNSNFTKDDQVVDSASLLSYPLSVNQKTNLSATIPLTNSTFTPVEPHAQPSVSHITCSRSISSPLSSSTRTAGDEGSTSQVSGLHYRSSASFVTRTRVQTCDPRESVERNRAELQQQQHDSPGLKGFPLQQPNERTICCTTTSTSCSISSPSPLTKISVKEEYRSGEKNQFHCMDAGENMPHAHVVRTTSKGLTRIRITSESSESCSRNCRPIFTQKRSEKCNEAEQNLTNAGKSRHRISRPSLSNKSLSAMNPVSQERHEARNPNSITNDISNNSNNKCKEGEDNDEERNEEDGIRCRSSAEIRTPAARFRTSVTGPVPGEMRAAPASHLLRSLPDLRNWQQQDAAAADDPPASAWLLRQPVNNEQEKKSGSPHRIRIVPSASPLNSSPQSCPPLQFFDDILRESFQHHRPHVNADIGQREKSERRRRQSERDKQLDSNDSGTRSQAPNAVLFVINDPSTNLIISRRETGSGVSSCILIHPLHRRLPHHHQVNQTIEQECLSHRQTARPIAPDNSLSAAITCNPPLLPEGNSHPRHSHSPPPLSVLPDQQSQDGMVRGCRARGGRVMRIAAWIESEAGRREGGGYEASGLPVAAAACCCCLNHDQHEQLQRETVNGRSFCDANHSAHLTLQQQQHEQLGSALFLTNPVTLTNECSSLLAPENGVADDLHGCGSEHSTSECDSILDHDASAASSSSGSTTNASANAVADPVLVKQQSPPPDHHHSHCFAERVTFSPSHSHQQTNASCTTSHASAPSSSSSSSSPFPVVVSHHSPDSSDYAACFTSCPAFPVRDPTLLITGYADDLVEKILNALLVHQELRNRLQLQERGTASSPVSAAAADALSLIRPHPSHPREQQQQQQVIQRQQQRQQQPDSLYEQKLQQEQDSVISLTSSISSQLEQYFTQSLTSSASSQRITNSACENQASSPTSPVFSFMSMTDVSVQPAALTVDNSDSDSSLGSEDGAFHSEAVAGISDLEYGNPFSYSLHTILEESERSCDEDHADTDPGSLLHANAVTTDATDAETCDYFRVAKRNSLIDPKDADESDLETERSSSPISGIDSPPGKQETAVTGSGSRLEKYFTFGLVDSAYSTDPRSLTHSPRTRLEPHVHHQIVTQITDTKFADDSCATLRLNKKWNHKGEDVNECENRADKQQQQHQHQEQPDDERVPVIDKVHVTAEEQNVCQTTSRQSDKTNITSAIVDNRDAADVQAYHNQLYSFMNKVLAQVAAMKNGSAAGQAEDCMQSLMNRLQEEAACLGPAAPASEAFLKALRSQLDPLIHGPAATVVTSDEGANNSDYGSECSSESRKIAGRSSASPVTREDQGEEDAGEEVGRLPAIASLGCESSPVKSSAVENNCSTQSNSQSLPSSSAQTKGQMKEEKLDCIGSSKFKVTSATESITSIRMKDRSLTTDVRKASAAVSESGESDATVSASISLPSYDSDHTTPHVECDVSMEMDDLFSSIKKFGESQAAAGDEDMDSLSLKSWEARIALLSQNSFKSKLSQAAGQVSQNAAHSEITVNGHVSHPSRKSDPNDISVMQKAKCIKIHKSSNVQQMSSSHTKKPVKAKKTRPDVPVTNTSGTVSSIRISDGNRQERESDSGNDCRPSKSDVIATDSPDLSQFKKKKGMTGESDELHEVEKSPLFVDGDAQNVKESPVTRSRMKEASDSERRQLLNNKNILNLKVSPIPSLNVQLQHVRSTDPGMMQRSRTDPDKDQAKSKSQQDGSPCRPARSHSKSRMHSKSSSPRPPVPFPDHLNLESSMMQTKQRAARFASSSMSLSSGNIPDAVTSSDPKSPFKSDADSTRTRSDSSQSRTRMLLASSTGVFKKFTAFKDENSRTVSPSRRLKSKLRHSEHGSTGGVPHISVSDYSASLSLRSLGSSGDTDVPVRDESSNQQRERISGTSLSLAQTRSESFSSIFSSPGYRFGTVTVSGEILFGLSYNYKEGVMEVTVKECRNLAAVDAKRCRSDPYVKAYILPDRSKSGKRKTKVKKHSLNPVFDEVLKFNLTVGEVDGRSLWLTVWHSDLFGRNDFLGEVLLPLGHGIFENAGLKWYPLQDKMDDVDSQISARGTLFLALKFVPIDSSSRGSISSLTRGELQILIKEAHDLHVSGANPFVKSYFLPDRSRTGKQKTPIVKASCQPKWNHTLVYDDLTLTDLKARCLELTVWHNDKLSSNQFLGGVRLSLGTGDCEGQRVDWMDSVSDEVNLWQQMLDRPGMWVYGELRLRSTMRSLSTASHMQQQQVH